jgi:glycosyltransferase involved in cell wall biosynthesis
MTDDAATATDVDDSGVTTDVDDPGETTDADDPEVSVVVCTLAPRESVDCLAVLDAQPFDDYEVVLRDDPGLSQARNAGIEAARADKIVFLDDDAVPRENYLPAAIDALAENPIVAGRVFHPGDGVVSHFCGGYDRGEERHYVTPEPGSFRRGSTGVTGCNMAFRREVFETVGGFDERFQWGHEETDFVRRAVAAGYRVLYDPELAVSHWYADSVRGYWKKMAHFGTADLRYDRKWHTPTAERVVETLLPLRLGPTPAVAAVESIGNVYRSVSYLRAWLTD